VISTNPEFDALSNGELVSSILTASYANILIFKVNSSFLVLDLENTTFLGII
jgi:hypothetical protein